VSAERFDVVVLGGGPGGQKAAVQAAKAGKRVLLVEREQAVGGECVHRGTIPSKTLRQSAMIYARWRCDFATGEARVRCDRALSGLMRRQAQVTRAHEQFMTRQMQRNGIAVWRGNASFASPNEICVQSLDGSRRTLSGDVIVIATGSRPRTPPNVPVDHEHVLDSDSILSLAYLPDSLVVLGAGVIACEFATIFAALGVKVTVIDKAERPLAFLDAEITERFLREFESLGGRFLGRRALRKVEFDGVCGVVTELDDGQRVASEKVLCALGRVAQVAGLALDQAGLAVNERGTLDVDEHCRTRVAHIYAVGDVIGPPALAATSMEQGRRAVRHALRMPALRASATTPVGIYTIPEMASVGATEAQARERHGSALVGRAKFEELARGQINGDQAGLLKLVCDPGGGQVLGAQIIGDGATELIHIAQLAIATQQEVDVFLDNVFNFPTFAEAYLVAALDVLAQREVLRSRDRSAA
jgi:NAD(P) transhydrogenase